MRRERIGLILATAAFCLAGCTVGPDFHRPQLTGAEGYGGPAPGRAPGATAADAQVFSSQLDVSARWWEAFGSPDIDRLETEALAANPDVTSAQAALRAARETQYAQRGALYPQVEGSLSANRQKNPDALASPVSSNATYFGLNTGQVSIAYAPDVFGGVRRQIEAATAQADNQRFMVEATYLTLTGNVALAALQAASLRDQIKAGENAVAINADVLRQLQLQQRLGQASAADVAAQETVLAQARLALPPLRKQLGQQRDLLARLIGRTPAEPLEEATDLATLRLPAELPLSLPSSLVDQRPDIRAAEASLHAASAQIGVAKAARLPNITLSAALGGTSEGGLDLLSHGNGFWTATGGLTQPIFNGGTLRHQQRAAEAAYDAAAAQYRGVVLSAFQQVADTLFALDEDTKGLAAAEEAQRAAARSLSLARAQLGAGETSAMTVLNAQAAYQQSLSGLIQARAARFADTVALYQALGGGWWNRADAAAERASSGQAGGAPP